MFDAKCDYYQATFSDDYYCLSKSVIYDAANLNTIDDVLRIDCFIEGMPEQTITKKLSKLSEYLFKKAYKIPSINLKSLT